LLAEPRALDPGSVDYLAARGPMATADDTIETRTRQIGRELFAQIDTSRPVIWQRRWWDDRIMNWSMADETTKVQMLRFIDVLPMLDSPEAIDEHLQAYFSDTQGRFPFLVRLAAALAAPRSRRGRWAARAIRHNASRLARRFIAGADRNEVLQTVLELRRQGMAFTLDLLGEAIISEREADEYQRQYLALIEHLGGEAQTWPAIPLLDRDANGPIPRVNVSLKVSALYSQFDPINPNGSAAAVKHRLRPILHAAMQNGAFVNLDMEQYAFKELTLRIFCEILMEPEFRSWPHVGVAIQAYLPEAESDLRRLLAWVRRRGTLVWVRLVKGAYWDYETVVAAQRSWPVPVFTQKWQSDACFERCTAFLLEHREWLRPAFASHNLRGMAYALALAEYLGVPPGSYELQMLFGMGDPLKRAFVKRGQRLRIYTPFGQLLPGMAYLVRRLLENTSNTSFLRATFAEHAPIEELLQLPGRAAGQFSEVGMSRRNTDRENLAPFVNEALTDFSQAVACDAMVRALAQVRSQFDASYGLWIGGRDQVSEEWIESINPAARTTIVGHVAKGRLADADQAVAAAKSALPAWRDTAVWRRAQTLFEIARRLRERRFELAAWEVYECGKQWREADADVAEAIDFCEFYARVMLDLAATRTRSYPGESNEYAYLARGVCAVISPWNFPLAILCGMTVAPLVAGNTVVIKPAEPASVVAAQFCAILKDVDLPPGVVNFLPGPGSEIGRRLVRHPDVAVIAFTGSLEVGVEINRAAAELAEGQQHVKHVIAEMGGKNAIIIDDDADLDEAVKGVVISAFGYQGQKCSACSRVIVLPSVFEVFTSRLRDAVASLPIGPPDDPANVVGPVIDQAAFDRLTAAIAAAKQQATCFYAGDVGELADVGYYVAPHIFVDVKPDSMLAQTELFGPVLAVLRAKDLDEAFAIANGTRYALTGGVYSRNPKSIARARREFQVGNLYINRKITGAEVDRQPFGGFKLSGIGAKAGGPDYLHHFLLARTITENTLRRGFAPDTEVSL
jgi:RHH-type proline utilization regulon transcriptional repressor/proline dehydrogenase/delta 1-pyrroline-5-carboxylate dehydrogenase